MSKIDELLDKIISIRANEKEYADVETLKYQRTTYDIYKGIQNNSVWRILLDESKTKWCVRDAVGFKVVDKRPNDQVILGPSNIKNLLLAKSEEDKLIGRTILDQLAKKIYESE